MFRQISQLGKHSAIYGAGLILQRLASFILLPLYMAYLSTADYGIQEVLNNTSSLLITVSGLGLISALYRSYFMYSDDGRRLDVAKTALSIFALSSAVVGGLLALFSRQMSGLLLPDASYSPLLMLTVLYIILSNIIAVPFAILRAKTQSIRYAVFSLAQFLIHMAGAIWLVAGLGRGVRGSLESMVLGQVAVLILFLPSFATTLKAHFSWPDLKEMLTFGLPLVPAMVAALSLTVSDRYFLRAFSTFDEIGVYGLGYRFGTMVQVLVMLPFSLSWAPVMWSVAAKPYAQRFYATVLTYFTAVALYVALGLSVLSPEVIRLMSRQEAYWRAWQVVPLVALSYVLYGLYYQLAVGLNLRKKTQYLPFVVGAAAGLNLLLNFVLIPLWGMMGAAAATLASYLALAILVYVVSNHFYPVSYEWGRLAKLAALFGFCYGSSLLIPSTSLPMALTMKVVLLLLCPLALYALRFFTPEEIARGRELVREGQRIVNSRFHRAGRSESEDP